MKYEESCIEFKSDFGDLYDSRTTCYLLKIKDTHGNMKVFDEDIEGIKEEAKAKGYTIYGLFSIPENLLLAAVAIPFPDDINTKIYARYMVFIPRMAEFNKWFSEHKDIPLYNYYRLELPKRKMGQKVKRSFNKLP